MCRYLASLIAVILRHESEPRLVFIKALRLLGRKNVQQRQRPQHNKNCPQQNTTCLLHTQALSSRELLHQVISDHKAACLSLCSCLSVSTTHQQQFTRTVQLVAHWQRRRGTWEAKLWAGGRLKPCLILYHLFMLLRERCCYFSVMVIHYFCDENNSNNNSQSVSVERSTQMLLHRCWDSGCFTGCVCLQFFTSVVSQRYYN